MLNNPNIKQQPNYDLNMKNVNLLPRDGQKTLQPAQMVGKYQGLALSSTVDTERRQKINLQANFSSGLIGNSLRDRSTSSQQPNLVSDALAGLRAMKAQISVQNRP